MFYIVYLCDIDTAEMLAAYGHKSINELGPEAERILAEYTFETDAQSGANIMSSGLWTFEEAEALIKKIADFQE